MDHVKKHFEAEAKEFDSIIIKLIPYYDQMLRALIDSIHFNHEMPIRVMDLGCGTGTIAKRISEEYLNSKIVCVDIASNMIDIAKYKLSKHKNTRFIVDDFSKIDFHETYDVVVSSLALHHLESDNLKKVIYKKIFNCLSNTGQFINADVVLASTEFHQNLYMNRWIEFMNKSITKDEIINTWIPTYHTEDRPAKLIDQLKWLEEIGFTSVDVIWKYYDFSVYTGMK
jgi:tRNA (cmo5U34)-methyltransferase